MADDRDLDEFSEEQPAVAPPATGEAADRDTLRIIVADEQLAAPWETFLPEERTHSQPADAAASAPAPPPRVPLQQHARRSLLVPAVLVLTAVIVLIGQRITTKNSDATPRAAAQRDAARAPSTPPARETVVAAVPAAPIIPAVPESSTRDTVSVERRLRPVGTTARAAAGDARARTVARPPALTRSAPAARTVVKEAANPTTAALAPPMPELPTPVAVAPPPREEPRASEPPAPTPAAVSAPAPAPEPGLTPEARAVLSTLDRYQHAFSVLDAIAVQDVWPSVDVKALDRAFAQLDEQTVDLQSCDVRVSGARAEAACTGTAIYVRKVGRKAARAEARRWTFTLREDSNQWVIDKVDVR